MSDIKLRDRVRVEFEGEMAGDGHTGVYVYFGELQYFVPTYAVTRIVPPMPDDQILYEVGTYRAFARAPGLGHDWRNLQDGSGITDSAIRRLWRRGELTTRRPR